MDPDFPPAIGAAPPARPSRVDLELLPSRRPARSALVEAIRSGRGPVALTGEPGVGKSTLRESLQAEAGPWGRWLVVEATPGLDAPGLYRALARLLGTSRRDFDRADLLDALDGRSLGGGRTSLAVEEAHNLDKALLEEVRVLTNRIGAADGFAAILLVGQAPLARTLGRRDGAGLASRLADHVHLRRIEADEAATLVAGVDPDRSIDADTVDRLHRVGEGNPGRIVALARRLVSRPGLPGPVATPAPPAESAEATAPWKSPLIGPTRPPIRVEEGLIEVGWQPEGADPGPADPAGLGTTADAQRIDDHYAALQAWQEWATNQGRHPDTRPAGPVADLQEPPEPGPSPFSDRRNVWADAEGSFAPYGRLFSRPGPEAESESEVENEADTI